MENMNNSSMMKENKNQTLSLLKFLILSSIGIFLFMIPISKGGEVVIPVAILSNGLQDILSSQIEYIITGIILITFIVTMTAKIFKPRFIANNEFLNALFNITPVWFVVRILGGIFIVCATFEIGPSFIWSENTGGLVLNSLLPILFSVFLFAGLFLPLLLDFGLLEFVGALLTKVMRPLFNLPGRSSIDCIASWLGDGTIGVLLTNKQYEEGYYTEREACVIGTNFSLVSITFSLVVADSVGLSYMFIPFYLTVTLASIVAAIVIPKLPPLSRKKDTFYRGVNNTNEGTLPKGYTSFKYGIEKALAKTSESSIVEHVFKKGFLNVIDMWFGVIPVVMAVGTLALIIAEYTTIFQILGAPFIPILNLLQIPEAAAASSTLMAGFADMLLPSIMAGSIQSDITRFVIASVSVTQLVYLSEVGALLLGSKIPVSLKELFIIFIERTLITLPIISLIAHMLF